MRDLRLQITLDDEDRRTHRPVRPARPLYFRQRTLTLKDEIVDRLIDATTGKASWTIHRPTRGWYLHIRSPLLPPGGSIPLRPARPDFVTTTMGVQDPTSTPLTFSLTTRVDESALPLCKAWIDDIHKEDQERAAQIGSDAHRDDGDGQQEHQMAGDFTAVDLSGNADAGRRTISGSSVTTSQSSPGHTARTSSISSSAQLSVDSVSSNAALRHARRRSSSKTPVASPDIRKKPSMPRFEGVREEEVGGGEGDSTAQNQATPPPASPAKPSQCYFLLLDGAARLPPPATTSVAASLAPGRIAEGSQRLGWARWAWSLMPEPLRPQLAFDTTKSFSVRWIEVRSSVTGDGGSSDGDSGTPSSVEVMRYEDEGSGWSAVFDSRTRGRFVFQEEAIRALRIDRAFWMAVSTFRHL